MKAQTTHFADCVFEYVISGGIDFYKVAPPLVNIIEASEKTREKSSGRLVDGLVERLVEKDTINDTTNDTINSLSDNERTVFDKIQVQSRRNLGGLGYEC